MARVLSRFELTIDLAAISAAYAAFALVVGPWLFHGYCTAGPAQVTYAAETTWWLGTHCWLMVVAVGAVAAIEWKSAFRSWFKRAVRSAAVLGLAYLLAVPALYVASLSTPVDPRAPMQTYGHR